jgi:hypothetical protein
MSTTNVHGEGVRRPFQPDLDRAIATNFAYLCDGEWLPLMVEYDPKAAPTESHGGQWQWFVDRDWLPHTFKEEVLVPALFRELPRGLVEMPGFRHCVLLVHRKAVASLVERGEWRQTILQAQLGVPMDVAPGKEMKPDNLLPDKAQGGKRIGRVVMGVIDQGIAFAHERFRNLTGSRVAFVWQQAALPTVPGFPFPMPGVELKAADIDAAIANTIDDEAAVYRSIGGLDFSKDGFKPLARRRSHGTLVLDLMAGEPRVKDEQNRPIIAVDMPEFAVGDPATSLLKPHAAWGLAYIMHRAGQLREPGEKLPVVVNLSYGPHEGPHDGTDPFEVFADLMITFFGPTHSTPLTVVLAAGNSRQGRVHAQAHVESGASKVLPWRIQPGGRTESMLQLWLNTGAQATVTLRAPSGATVSIKSPQSNAPYPASPADTFSAACSLVNGRPCCTLFANPTAYSPGGGGLQPIAESGLWKVQVQNDGPKAIDLQGWIRRSDTQSGRNANGRQSYFDDPDYERFTSTGYPVNFDPPPAIPPPLPHTAMVSRRGTLSGIATGRHTLVIGGYRRSDVFPAGYSSQGPNDNASRVASTPNWVTPSEDSVTCRGVLSAANYSGGVSPITGTSAAAPQAARRWADLWIIQKGQPVLPPGEFQPLRSGMLRPISLADHGWVGGLGVAAGNPQRVPRP